LRSIAPSAPQSDRAARRLVTVLFADIVGSTQLGERIDPEALQHLMSAYLVAMRAVVDKHLGTTERLIGDSVMAVFGARRAREDDALRAVSAAHEMRVALADLNVSVRERWGTELVMRIGVNTGEVITGSEDAVALGDVLGDAVNVAARLQSAAHPGEILIGSVTHALVRGYVDGEPTTLTVKGKSEPVTAFRVARLRARENRAGSRTRLVGRGRELAELHRAFADAASGAGPALVTVVGEAGVGKSRLLREFTDDLDCAVLRGRCLSYGGSITYWALAEVLRQAVDVGPDASAEVTVEAIRAALSDTEASVVDVLCSPLGHGSMAASAMEIAWALRRLLGARPGPCVVVLDDIQWADPTFLDLIEHLVAPVNPAPLLVVCMARPELLDARPEWQADQRIDLKPLSAEACEHLVGWLLPGGEDAAALAARIAERSGGHPLFAEELVAMLVDEGTVRRRDDGTWAVLADLPELELPATIDTILAARIDRVGPAERDMLDAASVIGQTFRSDVVAAMLGVPVEAPLAELRRRRLVVENPDAGADGEDLRFGHLLIRDAAYRAIPKARRFALHERLADLLEGDGRAGDWDEIIAHHFLQGRGYRRELGIGLDEAAEDGARAAVRLAAAGSRAVAIGSFDVGRMQLKQAIELLPTAHPRRAAVLLEAGCAVAYGVEPRLGTEILTEAAQAARDRGDEASEWRARLNLAMARTGLDPEGATEALFAEADLAEQVFTRTGDLGGSAEVWRARAAAYNMHADQAGRLAAIEQSIEYARRAGVPNARLAQMPWIVAAMVFGATPADEALAAMTSMLAEAPPPNLAMSLHRGAACFAAMLERDAEADLHLLRETAIARELGMPAVVTSTVRAIATASRGDYARALIEASALAAEVEDAGDLAGAAGVFANVSLYHAAIGHWDEAYATGMRVLEMSATDDYANFINSNAAIAATLLARGDPVEAERFARDAVRYGRMTDSILDCGHAHAVLARVLAAQGRYGEAHENAVEARMMFAVKQALRALREADELIASLPDVATSSDKR
jgi:class 3 adenylate cyclase/tetratricopeptide (TPR) repeat protein